MNSSNFVLDPISQDGALVTIALALVAVVAILTVIAMIVGARNKRKRKAAEAEEQRRITELKADGVIATNTAEGAPTRARDDTAAPRTASPPPSEPAPSTPHETAATPVAPLSDEPIAAAAPLDATPASIAVDSAAAAPADDGATPVTVLKGLGPKIAARLAELGVTRVDQLAWLDDAEAAGLDAQMGAFQGRMERDRWRDQARLLAQGDRSGYEAQFGKLG